MELRSLDFVSILRIETRSGKREILSLVVKVPKLILPKALPLLVQQSSWNIDGHIARPF